MKPLQNNLNNNSDSNINNISTNQMLENLEKNNNKQSLDQSLYEEFELENLEPMTKLEPVLEPALEANLNTVDDSSLNSKTQSELQNEPRKKVLEKEGTKIEQAEATILPDNKSLNSFNYALIIPALSYFIFPIVYFLKQTEENLKLKHEVTYIFGIVILGRMLDLLQSSLGLAILDLTLIISLVALAFVFYGIYNLIKTSQVVTPLYNIISELINNLGLTSKVDGLRKSFNQNLKLDKKVLAILVFAFFCTILVLTTVQASYYTAIKAMSNGSITEFKTVANYPKIHENSNSFKTTNRVDYDDYIDTYIEKRLPEIVEFNLNQIKNDPLSIINNDKIIIEKEGANYLVKHTIDQYRYSYNFSFNGYKWVITNLKMIF